MTRFSVSKLNWYLHRLRKMPWMEIPYRVKQYGLRILDRSGVSTRRGVDIRLALSDCEAWERLAPVDHSETTAAATSSSLSAASALLGHRFTLFGEVFECGRQINYHRDLKTGKAWPQSHWTTIDYRDGLSIGGIKFAWELNRLQHWPKLAMAGRLTGKREYIDEMFAQLADWRAANPYGEGINWISGIELGIRIVNLYFALRLVPAEELTEERRRTILEFVADHASHLYRYPSKYSSCANHALAEALGLFVAGLGFPRLPRAERWRCFGQQVLEREVLRQVLPDGSSFEFSVPYLQLVADIYLVYRRLLEESGCPISAVLDSRLRSVFEFISTICDARGGVPTIGDDDSGYLMNPWFDASNNFVSLLTTGSLLFDEPRWWHPLSQVDWKTRLLAGEERTRGAEGRMPLASWRRYSHFLQDSGLGVMIGEVDGAEVSCVVNCGRLGAEPTGCHGHADALSLSLSIAGVPFLVDPGTYLYHSGGPWRRYFRGTFAHNTITIDGKDQAHQVAAFLFSEFYEIRDQSWSDDGEVVVCEASHTGYSRLQDPVVHHRRVIAAFKERKIVVRDKLACRGSHDVSLHFHLHPAVAVSPRANGTYVLEAGGLRLELGCEIPGEVLRGSRDPLLGWYSAGFNRIEPTNTLRFCFGCTGTTVVRTEVRLG